MNWLQTQVGPLVVGAIAGGVGVWLLISPSTILKWVQDAHKDVAIDQRQAFIIIRIIASVMLAIAVVILVSILRLSS